MTLDPHQPETYPHRVLLLTTGLAPQVVTETLYALAVEQQPPFAPHEVHLVTTAEGAAAAREALADPGRDLLARLCADYGLPRVRFGEETLHVLEDAAGRPLDDIRTPADNRIAADRITALVARLTADPETALHVSLAGGRKTMGLFLGYAVSLYGRLQDRLSHVLINEPFESHRDFFYPPPEPAELLGRDGRPVSTREARVTLADIPFVRLRQGLPKELLAGERFSEAVAGAQHSVARPELVLDPARRVAVCGGTEVELSPVLFAFYAWMARRRLEDPERSAVHWTEADAGGFLAEYRNVVGELAHAYEMAAAQLETGITKEYFDEKKSRVNQRLNKALGAGATDYRIHPVGRRPRTRHGLRVDPQCIHFRAVGR